MLAAYVIPAGWPRRLSHGFWGNGTGYPQMVLGHGGGKGEKVARVGPRVMGKGRGQGHPLWLPHVSFDVIQAEGYTLVCAAPFGLLLALPSSAQLVLNDLVHVGW